jgi:hypothetical protein
LNGVCDHKSGVCLDPCPPNVTGAIVNERITNTFPFEIQIATFTTKNATLTNPVLVHDPYEGNYTIFGNSSLDQYHNGVVTQIWTFLITPIGTCILNADFQFQWEVVGYNGLQFPLTFHFNTQNFCGQVVNTSLIGAVELFSDVSLSTPSTTFAKGDSAYVLVRFIFTTVS